MECKINGLNLNLNKEDYIYNYFQLNLLRACGLNPNFRSGLRSLTFFFKCDSLQNIRVSKG